MKKGLVLCTDNSCRGQMAKETCPVWLGNAGQKPHIGFYDPAEAMGTDEEVTAVFRQVRDQIADRVLSFLQG